jgi:hypothetical protein
VTETGTAQQHYRVLIAAVGLIGTIRKGSRSSGGPRLSALSRLENASERNELPAEGGSRGASWRQGRCRRTSARAAEWSLIGRLSRAEDRETRCQEN